MILVVGVGRCGTSTVARLLHERLGVYLGDNLEAPTRWNPEGSYEDTVLRQLHVDFHHELLTLPVFHDSVINHLSERDEPWGIKDPRMAHHLGYYLQWFEAPTVIHCTRDLDDVVDSWCRGFNTTPEKARPQVLDRWAKLTGVLENWPHTYTRNFTYRVEEATLLDELWHVVDQDLGRRR
jgi:hypothetical protein